MLQYRVEIKGMKELQERFKQAPETTTRHLITAGNKSLISLQGTAKQLAPVDTSRLRQSILVSPMQRSGNVISGSVGTSLRYALAQEIGSGIYGPRKAPILPKKDKFLVFKGRDGKTIFARSVKGVKGRFYMKGSVERNQANIDRFFETALTNITRDLST